MESNWFFPGVEFQSYRSYQLTNVAGSFPGRRQQYHHADSHGQPRSVGQRIRNGHRNRTEVYSYSDANAHSSTSANADDKDDNSGNIRTLNVDGRPHTHFVLKFPNIFGNGENQIPLGSTINSAILTLKVRNSTDSDPDLYQLPDGWDESEVTWEERADGFGWSDEGADGTGSHKADEVGQFPAIRNWEQSMDVTATLQNWSNGEANVCWVLIDNSNNGAEFDSSEARRDRDHPKLIVNYTTP